MMRYLLLLKRHLKKKSYLLILLLVPLMVFLLKEVGKGDDSIMSIGVYVPGDDSSTDMFLGQLQDSESTISYVVYDSKEQLVKDVTNGSLDEAWIAPEDLDGLVAEIASGGFPSEKIQVVIKEQGLSHLLGKEILCSKVYPAVAKQLMVNYASMVLYNGAPSESELQALEKSFDEYGLSNSLFKMGYLDDSKVVDTSIVLMPVRGILALWLLLCGIAASMYYLEDQQKGLFLWWKTRFTLLRDIGYYGVIFLAPTIITIVSLIYSGNFTNIFREVPALLLYELSVICISMLLRVFLKNIKNLGILTPALIIMTCLMSPVFLDFKQVRMIQNYCPAFHYLSSIHDIYYLKILLIYTILLGCLVVLVFKLPVKVRQVFEAHLL